MEEFRNRPTQRAPVGPSLDERDNKDYTNVERNNFRNRPTQRSPIEQSKGRISPPYQPPRAPSVDIRSDIADADTLGRRHSFDANMSTSGDNTHTVSDRKLRRMSQDSVFDVSGNKRRSRASQVLRTGIRGGGGGSDDVGSAFCSFPE